MVRRAEIAQAGVRLGSDVLGKCRREPRLADARLAGDQHHPPFAALRLLPAAQQQLEFLVAPDERRLPRAQGLEAAYHPALAERPARRAAARRSRRAPAVRDPRDRTVRRSAGASPSAMTRVFGMASACSRAARFGVSPTTPRSCAAPSPIRSPTTTSPVAMPSRTRKSSRAGKSADRLDHRQPGAHRPLGIVLVRLRIAEIDQHAVAHVFGDKAVEAADGVGDSAVIGADRSRADPPGSSASTARSSRPDRRTSPSAGAARPRPPHFPPPPRGSVSVAGDGHSGRFRCTLGQCGDSI